MKTEGKRLEATGNEPGARFVVGIDLGTTNSAVAFVDTKARGDAARAVQTFPVPQLVAPGEIAARDTLPSFHYEPFAGQFEAGSLRLPWDGAAADHVVGVLARERGGDVPGRLVVSAKSWLSHSGVDRTADLLPWHGAPDVKKLPPAEVSARYLGHLRAAWNAAHPDDPLEAQDVVITVPASFDEVARELTVTAARRAGLPKIVLLEEPQAAFYAWMARHGVAAEKITPGQRVLVCDIGGGTTDLTLIEAQPGTDENAPVIFHRFAVGDHLILGGDNLDLALAHHIESRLGGKLEPRQWAVLIRRCQQAKETLLAADAPERWTIQLPAATGARLVGGARSVELTRKETVELLADGFLPAVGADARPARRGFGSGFQEFGLPYAPDPGITRYVAAFLAAHGGRPDAVLFNGGFFESPVLRERFLEVLGSWDGGTRPVVLDNERLDLAVAWGAARFGLARRGVGLKIGGGLARAYYLGVRGEDGQPAALCLAPMGLAEGEEVDLAARAFDLRIRQPAEFPLYVSSTRTGDRPGDVVVPDPLALTALPPVRTALRGRPGAEGSDTVPVRLHARLTEVGTLDVWCAEVGGRGRQWKLPFDVRAATRTERAAHAAEGERAGIVDEETAALGRTLIRDTFSGKDTAAVEGLVKRLETTLDSPRLEWPPSLLRAFWEEGLKLEPNRARSPIHEARWLNLLGFCLRPGYGYAVDDWRAAQTWRLLSEKKVAHPKNELCRAEWWILWRRSAGGLTAGQQRSLAAPLLAEIRRDTPTGWGSHESSEIRRLLGSLEWLDAPAKIDLGGRLLGSLTAGAGGRQRAQVWTLGRLGARVPLYGPLNTLVPAEDAERWIVRLATLPGPDEEVAFALVQIARRTGDRFRDVLEAVRDTAVGWLQKHDAPRHFVDLVRAGGELRAEERSEAFGESLPLGLELKA